MKSEISIIIPIYNIDNYLNRCIESVLNQTYHDLQIILVDDGSTDRSGKICDKYAEIDNRIQVIHKKNGGLVTARKAGLALAKGNYVGFVDGDDFIESTFYENLLYKMLEIPVDFVHSGFIREENGYSQIYAPLYSRVITSRIEKLSLIKKYVLCFENEVWTPSIWSKLFRRDFIQKCYSKIPDSQSYGEDLLAFCRCILESNRFALIRNTEYHYLVRKTSISHNWNVKKFLQECNLYNELCNIYMEYGYYSEIEEFMYKYLFVRMNNCVNQINKIGLGATKYIVPGMNILNGKRVVIYGAGSVGKNYMSQLLSEQNCTIMAWVDQKFKRNAHIICITPQQLKEIDYDFILIAIKDIKTADEIKRQLLELEIDKEKILWMQPLINYG